MVGKIKEYFGNLLVNAIKRNKPLKVKLLIYLGVDVAFKNNRPIRWAAYNGMNETILLLVKRGADIKVDNGKCLLDAATNHHWHTVGEILRLAYKDNEDVVHLALYRAEYPGPSKSNKVAEIIKSHLYFKGYEFNKEIVNRYDFN